jgi:error-prone DNA polymerase
MSVQPAYTEFAITSNFSFLRGASHPEEMAAIAAALGLAGFGLTDRNSVAGVVRAHTAMRDLREAHEPVEGALPRYHPGARLVFNDGTPDILAYPANRAGWGRLCRLLTLGNRRAEKGACHLGIPDLLDWCDDLQLIVMPPVAMAPPELAATLPPLLQQLRAARPGAVRLAGAPSYDGDDRRRLACLDSIATAAATPLIAVNDVLYHAPARRLLHDVVTCIRTHATLETAGFALRAHAERHLKPPAEMARLFREFPHAIAETQRLSAALSFSLDELRYEYPEETIAGFSSPQDALVHFTYAGAETRYPEGVPDKLKFALAHEIALIGQLGYAPYFLTVFDIVRFARGKGILCQGRGSAANSSVCFCLGITEVDPDKSDLLFERFISADRREPPDIDVDFEHARREEVIQYIYARYGRERAGLAATVISYRARSAIRETGKVFGFSEDTLDALSGSIWGFGAEGIGEIDTRRAGIDRAAPAVAATLALAREIQGFPRHLSQHVGGFVMTRGRLDELVPIQNAAMADRTVIEWDKDDLDSLGILKVDVLALGMLTCLKKGFELLSAHYGRDLTIATLPAEEPEVYRMLQRADSLGLFQVESRAQMSMLPRLKPEKFYDLVIQVAIVRPGPIQGDMVHPYLRRRQGIEHVSYPSKELEAVLGKTLGVPLFQEQAMKIAIVAAGFTPSEADKLRRAMATFRKVGTISSFQQKMIDGMVANGYAADFAERCFRQIEGFGEYGFPESHAASFALLVYASAWMKCHYPDVFAAGLLNAQPLGFYAPAQIVRDAREHGVEVREIDINLSEWDATLECVAPLRFASGASPAPHQGGMSSLCACAHGLPEPLSFLMGKENTQKTEGLGAVLPGGSQGGSPVREATRLHPRHASMINDIHTTHAVRLGFREIKGLSEDAIKVLTKARERGYDSVRDLWLRTGLSPSVLERLADADAFGSLGLSRRDALWAVKALGRTGDNENLPLFCAARAGARREPDAHLPPMPPGEEVVNDYRFLRLSLKAHPIHFIREELAHLRVVRNEQLFELVPGRRVSVAGLVLVRQRPGSAKGVIFMTLEDETGVANTIIWSKVFERHRAIVLGARFVVLTGKLQSQDGVVHVVAEKIEDRTDLLARLSEDAVGHDPILLPETLARADEVRRPQQNVHEKRMDAAISRRRRMGELAPAQGPPLQAMSSDLPLFRAVDLDVPARATRHALPKGRNFR